MKRSSKILALLLSVALICGALIVASFATAEDATVYKATDFENEELTVFSNDPNVKWRLKKVKSM